MARSQISLERIFFRSSRPKAPYHSETKNGTENASSDGWRAGKGGFQSAGSSLNFPISCQTPKKLNGTERAPHPSFSRNILLAWKKWLCCSLAIPLKFRRGCRGRPFFLTRILRPAYALCAGDCHLVFLRFCAVQTHKRQTGFFKFPWPLTPPPPAISEAAPLAWPVPGPKKNQFDFLFAGEFKGPHAIEECRGAKRN